MRILDVSEELKREKARRSIKSKVKQEKKIVLSEAKTNKFLMSVVIDKEAPDMLNRQLVDDIKRDLYEYGLKLGKYYDI